MIGRTIGGRYRIARVLRAGGMGVVCEADDQETGRKVALKLVHFARPFAGDGGVKKETADAVIERFHREARAAAAIGSEHIIELLDSGTDAESSNPFMVMELLVGEDLQQVFKRLGPLPPDVALRIAAQVCVGLISAHEAGVIHRDIKPGNLFLAERGDEITVTILDFGIAKLKLAGPDSSESSITQTGGVLGSPHYMSPEQVQHPKDIDPRADLWSLGVVLYKALTGKTPHQDIGQMGPMMVAICREAPRPVQELAPWVSPRVAALMFRTLQMRPEDRYASARKLLDALAALLPEGWRLRKDMIAPLSNEQRATVAFRFDPGAPPQPRASLVPAPPALSADAPATEAPAEEPADEAANAPLLQPPRARTGSRAIVIAAVVLVVVGLAGWRALVALRTAPAAPPATAALREPEPLPAPSPPTPAGEPAPVADVSATVTAAASPAPPPVGRPGTKATATATARPATGPRARDVVDPWGE